MHHGRQPGRSSRLSVIDGFIDGYVDCDHYDYDDHDDGGVEYL